MKTTTAILNATMKQMTKMSQRKKTRTALLFCRGLV